MWPFKNKKEKKKKEEFVDDGRVIASMDHECINGYRSKEEREKHRQLQELNLNRKERWAIYKGALRSLLPSFAIFIGSLIFVILFLYLVWIR